MRTLISYLMAGYFALIMVLWTGFRFAYDSYTSGDDFQVNIEYDNFFNLIADLSWMFVLALPVGVLSNGVSPTHSRKGVLILSIVGVLAYGTLQVYVLIRDAQWL